MRKSVLFIIAICLPATVFAANSWEYRLSPYLWFAGVDGDVATIPGSPTVPIKLTASDALEDNETSFMAFFEARKQRHGLLLDLIYTDTRTDEDLIEDIGLVLTSVSKNTLFSASYEYGIYESAGTRLDLLAGLRYWDVDSSLRFKGGLGALAGRRVDNSEDWLDPLLGVKGKTRLGESNFYLAYWAIFGGFGAGSESFYDASLNLGYQWNDAIGTTLGYRQFDVDYDDDGFVYDIQQFGWALGLTWKF